MGGDQCYPQATREEYKKRLLQPFNWAFNVPEPEPQAVRDPRQPRLVRRPRSPSTACSAPRATSSRKPRATSSAAGSASSTAAIGRCACRTTGGSGAPTSSSRSISTPRQVNYFEAMAKQMGPKDNLIICLAEPSWMLADLQGLDEEENFFKITSIARARGARIVRRDRRRLAPLQPLLRPRARRAFHHVGRRRRLPASDPRPQEQHLGALARAAGGCRDAPRGQRARRAPGRRLGSAPLRHPSEAQHARRPTASSDQAVQDVQDAYSSRCKMRRVCAAGASRCRRRRPSATRARRAAISSASATSCSRSTTPASPSASACSTGSSPGSSRPSSPPRRFRSARSTNWASRPRSGRCCRSCRSISSRP